MRGVSNVLYGIRTLVGWENFPNNRKADHTWFFQITAVMSESVHVSGNLMFVEDSLIQFISSGKQI